MAISIKIEDSSPPPPSLQQDFVSSKVLSSSYGLFENSATSNDHSMTKLPNRNSERREEKPVFVRDSKRQGTTYKGLIKSRHSSPEHHDSDIRSVSRSPSVQRCHSRSVSSRHSIEIKSEQSTPPPPPAVKKLSSHHRCEWIYIYCSVLDFHRLCKLRLTKFSFDISLFIINS